MYSQLLLLYQNISNYRTLRRYRPAAALDFFCVNFRVPYFLVTIISLSGIDQLLLRGARLKNTAWICGAVIYTGHDAKILLNSKLAPLKQWVIDWSRLGTVARGGLFIRGEAAQFVKMSIVWWIHICRFTETYCLELVARSIWSRWNIDAPVG